MAATTAPSERAREIMQRLTRLRAADAPTHGGHVLSYVYDSGLAALDELAASAMRAVQPLNGLDPTTFTSVGVMERELVGFARALLHGPASGPEPVVGTVTSGGTESCLLAVKAARDRWRAAGGQGTPRILAPATAHAAFQKAAALFDLAFEPVPVDAASGTLPATRLLARLGADVALVVVSAPAYPTGALDPVAAVAAGCAERGIPCHVDACFGGWILPFWRDDDDAPLPAWDFSVPGVTSISADAHKYGYAPKGVSVLLQRGRDLQRAQYFATTNWPGYPVVNPTLLSSKSAAPLAAAWAIIHYLGREGYARLAQDCLAATRALRRRVADIEGLRVIGAPVGPLLAVVADAACEPARRVDPHHWADAAHARGWALQQQPQHRQTDGSVLPASTHLTITPVTAAVLEPLGAALAAAADAVRGRRAADPGALLAALPAEVRARIAAADAPLPDAAEAGALLAAVGLAPGDADTALPAEMAPLLALVAALPPALAARLLAEFLARLLEPDAQ